MLIPNLKSGEDKDFRFVENATIHITESTIPPSNSLRQGCAKRLRKTSENVVTVVSAMSCGACT